MAMTQKHICIIGAGIGGLTLGAMLSKHGFKVTLFEKESLPGGRALTLDMTHQTLKSYLDILAKFHLTIAFSEPPLELLFQTQLFHGYHLDLGFHVFSGELLTLIKAATTHIDLKMIESKLHIGNKGNPRLFVTTFDKFTMLPNLLRLFLASDKTMKELETISLTETIDRYGTGKMKLVLELSPRLITTENNLDQISTGEVLQTQRQMKLRGVRYPHKGLSHIINTLVHDIKKQGGTLHLNTPVSKIIIDQNKAIGLIAKEKHYPADIIVSNILVQNLHTLIDNTSLPPTYTTALKKLRGTASLCAYYALKQIDKKLLGKNFIFIERNAGLVGNHVAGMVDFMITLPESEMAPPNQYLVQAYAICTPHEARNQQTLEKLKHILDKNLENIMPQYQKQLIWAIYPVIYHLDGVAKTLDNEKPDVQTPIENFFLVGDCVKAPGIGFNCALNSARLLRDLLIKKLS
jgi:phytoene dehydrogenase-like protein